MVQGASTEQLAELIEREREAFDAFRYELRTAADNLAAIDDPAERAAEARRVERTLAKEHVQAVDRKLREATRSLKWDIPCTVAQLAVGGLGLLTGDPSFSALSAGLVTGGKTAASTVRKHREHRLLPGYFLWRLKS